MKRNLSESTTIEREKMDDSKEQDMSDDDSDEYRYSDASSDEDDAAMDDGVPAKKKKESRTSPKPSGQWVSNKTKLVGKFESTQNIWLKTVESFESKLNESTSVEMVVNEKKVKAQVSVPFPSFCFLISIASTPFSLFPPSFLTLTHTHFTYQSPPRTVEFLHCYVLLRYSSITQTTTHSC